MRVALPDRDQGYVRMFARGRRADCRDVDLGGDRLVPDAADDRGEPS
jgi:hypothetical protein